MDEMPLEQREAHFKHFIQSNLHILNNFEEEAQKAEEIVKMVRFYFTKVYKENPEEIYVVNKPPG